MVTKWHKVGLDLYYSGLLLKELFAAAGPRLSEELFKLVEMRTSLFVRQNDVEELAIAEPTSPWKQSIRN